jgi:hypothetical protein
MTRKLMLLNLTLVALLTAAGFQMRQRWDEASERERRMRLTRPNDAAAPAAPKIDGVQPAPATNYTDVATKMLFARDRNPDVVIEAAPEEPVPAFPVAYGVLAFGDSVTAFMSEKAGAPQKSYRINDNVGPFRLASLSREEVTLEWKDKRFVKAIAELKPKADAPPPAAEAEKPKVNPENNKVLVDRTSHSAEQVVELQKKGSGTNPWVNTGGANHACQQGDNTPPGTVVNGYRKVVKPSMFGQTCLWEPAR